MLMFIIEQMLKLWLIIIDNVINKKIFNILWVIVGISYYFNVFISYEIFYIRDLNLFGFNECGVDGFKIVIMGQSDIF